MEAMVCALLNELDRRGIAEQVIAEASRNGLIDIMGFWAVHKKDDISRIADDIHHRYSKDEQEVIRKLLSAKK
jgi:acyl-ACP thioesterase